MRASALVVTLLLAASASAQTPRERLRGSRRLGRVGGGQQPPTFELLKGGGGVSHVMTAPLDSLFSAEMTGNWFALRGDGTTAGTVALSATGSPTTQTDRVCPSGPDCASVSSQRLDGTDDAYKTADLASPTGDVSCWAVVRQDDIAAGYMLVSKDSNEATNRALEFSTDTTGRVRWDVYKTDGSATSYVTGANAVTAGLNHFIVGTYDFVTDGTSVSKVYVDGSQSGATVSTAVGPLQAAASTFWGVGYREYGGAQGFRKGNVLSAGCTEKVLSAATITAMNTAVRAQLQGSRGETVTTTRSTVRSCIEDTSQTGSLLAANRPCVRDGALEVYGAATNLVIRSGELGHAAWSLYGLPTAPTRTANAAIASDGTKTAAQLAYPAVANTATHESVIYATAFAGTAAAYTGSIDVMKASGTGSTVYLWFQNQGTGAIAGSAASCALSTTKYTRCTVTATLTAVNYHLILGFSPTKIGSGATSDVTVYASAGQAELGSAAKPYCPTTTAAATCNADVVSVSTTGWPNATGELRLTFSPFSTTGNQYLLDSRSADNTGMAVLVSSSTLIAHMGTAGSATTVTSGVLTWTPGQAYAIRVRWGSGNIYVYRDDVLVASNVTGTANMPTHHSTAKIGSRYTDTEQANGLLHSIEVRP